ncbi:MAG: hypothetical protein WC666_02955 [Candidatus Paceibacterota bacterium]
MKYLSWNETIISDFSEKNIGEMYEKGYVFTRISRGTMQQTRSVRIDLSLNELSSENRRILKKTEEIIISEQKLPLNSNEYDFSIGKMAKDFYDTKFGQCIMSAQKVKEMLTDPTKSNFTSLLVYDAVKSSNSSVNSINHEANSTDSTNSVEITNTDDAKINPSLGFTICYKDSSIIHYSYPFYDLTKSPKDMGLGMMTKAIEYAKEQGLKYVYLGSLQRPTDTYKLQFEGLEWFDGKNWQKDIGEVKEVLKSKNEMIKD